MASIDRNPLVCRPHLPAPFPPVLSDTWREEIQEVLESAGEAAAPLRADPDWRAASLLLVRHCLRVGPSDPGRLQ